MTNILCNVKDRTILRQFICHAWYVGASSSTLHIGIVIQTSNDIYDRCTSVENNLTSVKDELRGEINKQIDNKTDTLQDQLEKLSVM